MSKLQVSAALLVMSLSVVALADQKTVSPAVVAKPQPGLQLATVTQAEILNPKLSCGSPSSSAFNADIKNTDTVTAIYTPTFVMTEKGQCTKTEVEKNCTGFCPGHCVAWGPDTTTQYTPTPTTMSIAAGATMHLHIAVANRFMKKAQINILEQGKALLATKPVAIITPCIF